MPYDQPAIFGALISPIISQVCWKAASNDLFSMAFRAGPVAAAVERPEWLAAVVALMQLPTEFLGATGRDIRKGSFLRRHHHLPVLRSVLGTEATYDVRQFDARSREVMPRIRQCWAIANAGINHASASFPRRDRRWSGGAADGGRHATVR